MTYRPISEGPDSPLPPVEKTRRHGHYYKDVRHLAIVDWYRLCDLFGVVHPCAQHAGKKVVYAGIRGAKDQKKDIQEAIDTLQRWLEMIKEDEANASE